MAGTNFFVPHDEIPNLQVAFKDENGKVVFAQCQGVPQPDAHIFAAGALIRQTDAAPDAKSLYINAADSADPSFEKINEISDFDIQDGSITTAKLADGNVTNVKLDNMAAGSIKVGDLSNRPADLAVGTNGQYLGTDGTVTEWRDFPNPDVLVAINYTGVDMTPGTLVYITGFDGDWVTIDRANCALGIFATHVIQDAIPNNSTGTIHARATVTGVDTSLWAQGTILYQSNVAPGGVSSGTPADAVDCVQEVGVVEYQDAVSGVAYLYPGDMVLKKVGSYNIQNGAVGFAQIADGAVTYSKVDQSISGVLAVLVKNTTGLTIPKSALVRITGLTFDGYPSIAYPDASQGELATHVVAYDFPDTTVQNVYPVTIVSGFDTSMFAPGNVLFSNPSSPGYYTATQPTGANYVDQEVGLVITSDVSTGSAYFYPGRMIIRRQGQFNLQDKAVTPQKMDLTVAVDCGSPKAADNQLILNTTALLNDQSYGQDGTMDTLRNVTVTIVDPDMSIVSGTVTISGTGGDGTFIYDYIDISGGAGTYAGTKMFLSIAAIETSGVSNITADETISVGIGNVIGVPSNVQNNFAYKGAFSGGAVPSNVAPYSGINTSGVSIWGTVPGDLYNGTNHMTVYYNVGL